MSFDPDHLAWCRNMVEMIRVGGVWGIPRSGLIFTKTAENEMTLTARMPWMPEMEGVTTPEHLAEQQQDEYEATREHMQAAGITMHDSTITHNEEAT